MNLYYLDENNNQKLVDMGCYGIGTARCMASVIEQHHDENGIIWPASIAPYTVCIVLINSKDDSLVKIAGDIYDNLSKNNVDVLLDDRDERPGVKFKDMDLIGIPIRITVGKKANEGTVEFKTRDGRINKEIAIADLLENIKDAIGD